MPWGLTARIDAAPVKAGGRGGPVGLGAGDAGPTGTPGREDADGGAGTMGTEDDGGEGIAVSEAAGISPPGVGTALDGTTGPEGEAGAAGPVFCGGTVFAGAVFNGGITIGGTVFGGSTGWEGSLSTSVEQGTVTCVVVVIVIGGTTGDPVDSTHSIQGTVSVSVSGTVAAGVTGEDVLLNGGAVDLGHSWQIVVSAEVVVLHGMVTVDSDGGEMIDELVINGVVAAEVVADEFNARGYTSISAGGSAFVIAPKPKARTKL